MTINSDSDYDNGEHHPRVNIQSTITPPATITTATKDQHVSSMDNNRQRHSLSKSPEQDLNQLPTMKHHSDGSTFELSRSNHRERKHIHIHSLSFKHRNVCC
jgi:hypothetical protein